MEFVGRTGDSGGGMFVVSILICTVTKLNLQSVVYIKIPNS